MDKPPLKITFVVCNPDRSGGIRIVAEQARLLKEKGHKITIIGVDTQKTTPRMIARSILRHREWPKTGISLEHFETADLEVILIKRPNGPSEADFPNADIIIATWWLTAEWIADLPENKGTKTYFVQGYEPLYPSVTDPERVKRTYTLPFHQIGVCRWLNDQVAEIQQSASVTPHAMLVENGIDLIHFNAPPRQKQDHPTVGYMYSGAGFKNPDLAIATLHKRAEHYPETRFIVFGAEPPGQAHTLPQNTRFHLRPAQADIPGLYASCDAWLFSSDHEGFGLPLLEAMACRTPLVATEAGVSPEIVSPQTGYLSKGRTPDALAAGLDEILGLSDNDWQTRSAAARATAEHYTWERSGMLFEAALYKALNGPPINQR